MQIMRVKHRSHKFASRNFFIAPYVTMHEMLECINNKYNEALLYQTLGALTSIPELKQGACATIPVH